MHDTAVVEAYELLQAARGAMPGRRHDRATRPLLAAAIPILLCGCVSPAVAPGEPKAGGTALFSTPTDGHARYHYPASGQVFAEGRFAGGKRIGRWCYYFRDGQPFAMGDFDEQGLLTGPWRLWTRTGDLSQERRRVRCVDTALMDCPPGFADLDVDPLGSSEERRLFHLSPCSWPAWNGTGTYWRGFWQDPAGTDR